MDVSLTNIDYNNYSNYNYQQPVTTSTPVEEENKDDAVVNNTSKNRNSAAVYDKSPNKYSGVNMKDVNAAIEEANNKGKQLEDLIKKVLLRQGNESLKAGGVQFTKDFFEKLQVDEATRLQAQEDISEDGYYGVKKTSERILDFAKAISGGDESKIGLLKDAVLKGFEEAEKVWGGSLPDISQQTKEAVLKGFEEWEASFKE